MSRRRRKFRTRPVRRDGLVRALTLTVVALQLALLVMFWWFPEDPPQRGTLWQALWARANMPPFYPLVGLILVGPPATYLALTMPGRHRRWLLAAWAAFLLLVAAVYSHRIIVMLEILWKFG